MDPLIVRWDRTVIHPDDPAEDTIVCCLTEAGQPVALFLDDELREALGLQLVDPAPDDEPRSRPARRLPCEGGEFDQCGRHPAWAVREKGDRMERNWSFACAQHLNRVACQYGERAEIDLVRIAVL